VARLDLAYTYVLYDLLFLYFRSRIKRALCEAQNIKRRLLGWIFTL